MKMLVEAAGPALKAPIASASEDRQLLSDLIDLFESHQRARTAAPNRPAH